MADQFTGIPPPSTDPYVSKQCLHRFFDNLAGTASCVGLLILILWLIWISFISDPQFSVQTLTLSNANTSSDNLIAGDWDANFIFKNPNSVITFNYDGIQAILFHNFFPLSSITLPPFTQGTKKATSIRATFISSIGDFYNVDDIDDKKNHGVVHCDVHMEVRVKPSPFAAGWKTFRVYCCNLPIAISSKSKGGALVGGPKKYVVNGRACGFDRK